jgi:hypothetical protein
LFITCAAGNYSNFYTKWEHHVLQIQGNVSVTNACDGINGTFSYSRRVFEYHKAIKNVNYSFNHIFLIDIDTIFNLPISYRHLKKIISETKGSNKLVVASDWRCWIGIDCPRHVKEIIKSRNIPFLNMGVVIGNKKSLEELTTNLLDVMGDKWCKEFISNHINDDQALLYCAVIMKNISVSVDKKNAIVSGRCNGISKSSPITHKWGTGNCKRQIFSMYS